MNKLLQVLGRCFKSVKTIIEKAKKYFVIGFGNRNGKGTTHTYFITLIKRRERNDFGHNNK